MLDNIKDSIKAKLYDFAYTPFMSSFLISWVLLNHKYLLIYFGNSTTDEKLTCLSECHLEFLYPLYIALIYVFIYPAFALGFYYATLWYNKFSMKIKQSIEDETPVTQEKARELKREHYRLSDERDAARDKLKEKEEEYKVKLQNDLLPLQNEVEAHKAALSISDQMINTLQAEREKFTSQHDAAIDTYNTTINGLEQQLSQAQGFLASKNDECAELEKKMADMEKQLVSVGVVNATPALSGGPIASTSEEEDARIKVLQYLHDSYETTHETNLLNKIMTDMGIARAVARKIINDLIQENILSRDSINQISITPENNLKLIEMVKGIKE